MSDQPIANATLADHVRVFENAMSAGECQALIDRFEASDAKEISQRDGGHSFAKLDVTKHWPEDAKKLTQLFFNYFSKYQVAVNARHWPQTFAFEHLQMKRYLPNGRDEFPTHADVMDYGAARRFMTAFIYLNTPDAGETTFPNLNITVAAEQGKMLVFPPLWMFPHAGLPPKSVPKYILHTYLHYA